MSKWNTESMGAVITQENDGSEESTPESGEYHIKDALERSFERGASIGKAGSECEHCAPGECDSEEDLVPCSESPEDRSLPEEPASVSRKEAYPDLSNLTTKKIHHKNLLLSGVCCNCACCGHKLSDAQSILAGIGPICNRKGYKESPVDADEMQALIDLAEFPELVDFLMEHYKPLGIRGLVNGLVRVASLNRPHGRGWVEGNVKVFSACVDAIQSLGHKLMAELLRETLVIMTVKDVEEIPGSLAVWVKRRDWTKYWSWDVKKRIPGSYFSRQHKANIVPVHAPGDPSRPKLTGRTRTRADGQRTQETAKGALWEIMLKHYEGCVAKVNGKVVKIVKKKS